MAGLKPIAALIILNTIFFTCVSSTYATCPPKPTPSPPSTPKPTPSPPSTPKPAPSPPSTPKLTPSPPSTPKPTPSPPSTPKPAPSPPSTPKPAPCPPPTTPVKPAKCPKDTLKFGVCGDWLGLVHEVIGTKPSSECCAVLEGLADVEAALCLCTAIKANLFGVLKFKIPVAISLVINSCGKKVPEGFVC